jgi:glycosyltransferase involved in cell wall biosynthesis
MESPLLSVCLITYNHSKFIKEAIDSVLNQITIFKFELIIADDFSTDGTRDILIDYQKKYPNKIELILQEKNVGPAQNFIDLISNKKGKYIAYFEGDDYWTNNFKLQKQVDFLEANLDYSICFHKVNILNENTNQFIESERKGIEIKDTSNIDDLINGNYIYTPSVVFRNNFYLPSWYKEVKLGDWCLYILLTSKGEKIKYLNETMAVYRIHDNSIFSSNKNWPISKQIDFSYEDIKMYNILIYYFGNKSIYSKTLNKRKKISYLKIKNLYVSIKSYSESKKLSKKILLNYFNLLSFKEIILLLFNYLIPKRFANFYNSK